MDAYEVSVGTHKNLVSNAIEIDSSIFVAVFTTTANWDAPNHMTSDKIDCQNVVNWPLHGGFLVVPITAMSKDDAALASEHIHCVERVVRLIPHHFSFLIARYVLQCKVYHARLVGNVLGLQCSNGVTEVIGHVYALVDTNHGGFVGAAHLGEYMCLRNYVSRVIVVHHYFYLWQGIVCDNNYPFSRRLIQHYSWSGSTTDVFLTGFQLRSHCLDTLFATSQ